MSSNSLFNIVSPVLYRICDFYIYEKNGYQLQYEAFLNQIKQMLIDIRRKVEVNQTLQDDYRKIEFPLIFFIDYIVKESGFTFSHEYVPIAHDYNELSGDDKFFDLLDDALTKNESKDIIELYYIMLGLGFDGAYHREPEEVLKRMQKCRDILGDRLPVGFDEILDTGDKFKVRHNINDNFLVNYLKKRKVILIMIVITLLCFSLNLLSIHLATEDFGKGIKETLYLSSPSNDYLVNTELKEKRTGVEEQSPQTGIKR